MLLYHTTFAAEAILAEGFRDGAGSYGTNQIFPGVWLANRPLDINEGADGDTVLVLDIPEDVVTRFEWTVNAEDIPEGWVTSALAYREFLVPAEVVNRYGPPQKLE
jgi:hypothetical protein